MSDRGQSRRTGRSRKGAARDKVTTPAVTVEPDETGAAADEVAARTTDDAVAEQGTVVTDDATTAGAITADGADADADRRADEARTADGEGGGDAAGAASDAADTDADTVSEAAADRDEDGADIIDSDDDPKTDRAKTRGKARGTGPGRSGGPKSKPAEAQMTKAQKRAAARVRAAKVARRKRRLQVLGGALVVIVVIGGAFGGFVYFSEQRQARASCTKPAADAEFPPLPGGSDPALSKKPAVSAGTGEVSQLTKTVLIQGKCATTKAGQTVTVNYVGVTFKDGKEFDASWKRSETFDFPLGQGRVIPGWDQGLVGVKVGSRIQLDIPPDLAYGNDGAQGAPVGALRFVVDVLDAKTASEPAVPGVPGG